MSQAEVSPKSMQRGIDTPTVILLGAGQPFHGQTPSALKSTPDKRRVLDWIFEAFAELTPHFHFVGGYHLEEVASQYPQLTYSVNPNWQNTGSIGSLFSAPLEDTNTVFVCYSDIVFRRSVVDRMQSAEADVLLAIDSGWQFRYEARSAADLAMAEKVCLNGHEGSVSAIGKHIPVQAAHGEFIGLIRFSPRAMREIMAIRNRYGQALAKEHLPELITQLLECNLTVRAVDVDGGWAELNAPQDLARFVLGTKAQTLARLRPMLQHSRIGDLYTLPLSQWQSRRDEALQEIMARFGGTRLVVRSSALSEDGWHTANAGVFVSLLDVPGDDAEALARAIDEVAESYGDTNGAHEVLIQEMLRDVAISGVAFTRSLTYGAPYYVINYDDTSRKTNSVTDGTGTQLKTVVLHRGMNRLPEGFNPHFSSLLQSLRELEALVGHDSLDVEFAITGEGRVHLFQLRPIAVNHKNWQGNDAQVDALLNEAETLFLKKQVPSPFVLGRRTIFGLMPDWNPAEIIGTVPRRLAAGLYRMLIMDEIWAAQRAEYGYRDVRPQPLMVQFAGHPYVDVRACFNSFIPASLPDALAERLVAHYLDYLEAHPHYHDKVEFQIAFTCLTLDFDRQADRLRQAGFSEDEISLLKSALAEITRNGMARVESDMAVIRHLERRFELIRQNGRHEMDQAFLFLEDARRYGTLPFAHLARGAFVAVSLLKSAVQRGIVSAESVSLYLNSIATVAHDFTHDAARVAGGELAWDVFVRKYGHLRPGTYEITSLSYADDAERYLRPLLNCPVHAESETAFAWPGQEAAAFSQALAEMGLPSDLDAFDRFARTAIEGREYAKFMFTRNLSAALDALVKYGAKLGLSRDQLSHIPISDFAAIRTGQHPADVADWLRQRAAEGEAWYALSQGIELPYLLSRVEDLRAFYCPENEPNFISAGAITAELLCIADGKPPAESLAGKIVLIQQADPGYDWLFGHQIGGLITAYGGANSHMAIRAAEFGLPAAIGVGEVQYKKLARAKKLCLDCAGRRIEILL